MEKLIDFYEQAKIYCIEQVFADHKEEIAVFQKAVGSLLNTEGK